MECTLPLSLGTKKISDTYYDPSESGYHKFENGYAAHIAWLPPLGYGRNNM
jgi:hypothetical protein